MRKPFDNEYQITQIYGVNPEYYKEYLVKQPDGSLKSLLGHNGIDFGVPNDTPLKAPIAGKVIEATMNQNGYGYYVKIENDIEGCIVAHMRRIDVQVGFILKEGDSLGLSNNTGKSTGPHVHLGYYRFPRDRSNGYGGFIDPMPYIVTVKTYTQAEYDAAMADRTKFWTERDAALAQLFELHKKLDEINAIYTAIAALGIVTVDDLQKERQIHENKIIEFMRERAQVLDRNVDLAKQIEKIDKEESVTLTEAEAGINERDRLRKDLAEVKKTVGASINTEFPRFLEHLRTIIAIVEDYFSKQKKPSDFQPGVDAPIIAAKSDDWWKDWVTAAGLGGIFMIGISLLIWEATTILSYMK